MLAGDLSSLVEAAAQEIESLEAIEHQNASLLLELVEDVKCYMQLLSLLLDQQAAFIAQQKLTTQKAGSFANARRKLWVLPQALLAQRTGCLVPKKLSFGCGDPEAATVGNSLSFPLSEPQACGACAD